MSKDDASCADRWVDLIEHLEDVEREVGLVAEGLAPMDGLSAGHLEAARLAGRYHDLGKAHSVFANTVRRSCPEGEQPPGEGPSAKSRHRMGRHERKYFRQLISALALLHPDSTLLNGSSGAARLLTAVPETRLSAVCAVKGASALSPLRHQPRVRVVFLVIEACSASTTHRGPLRSPRSPRGSKSVQNRGRSGPQSRGSPTRQYW